MNHRMIRYIIGSLIQMEAAMFLLPAFTALLYEETVCIAAFLGSAVLCVIGGQLLIRKETGGWDDLFLGGLCQCGGLLGHAQYLRGHASVFQRLLPQPGGRAF